MKSRWILNFALIAVIGALAALAYFRPAFDSVDIPPPLTDLTRTTVTQVRIERPGRERIALESAGGRWRMREPVTARASPFNMESLLLLATARSEFRAGVEALEKYGLDKPIARIWLNDEQIDVGALHPIQQQYYVRYRDTVYLIPASNLSAAFLSYNQLLDTRLLEEGRKLMAIQLPGLSLVRKDGAWQREPAAGKKTDADLSTDRLNNFASDWEYIHALAVERRASRPALAQVRLTFEQDGKRDTLALDVLAYEPEFVLARRDEGLEYHFPQDTRKRLLTLEPAAK